MMIDRYLSVDYHDNIIAGSEKEFGEDFLTQDKTDLMVLLDHLILTILELFCWQFPLILISVI